MTLAVDHMGIFILYPRLVRDYMIVRSHRAKRRVLSRIYSRPRRVQRKLFKPLRQIMIGIVVGVADPVQLGALFGQKMVLAGAVDNVVMRANVLPDHRVRGYRVPALADLSAGEQLARGNTTENFATEFYGEHGNYVVVDARFDVLLEV